MRKGAQYAGAVTFIFLLGLLCVFAGFTGRAAVVLGDLITPHEMEVTP